MVFHWSLRDSNSPQVSCTLLGILADLNNAIVWVVSTRHIICKFSSPFINPSVTVPVAPIIIGINVTFMFHSFFQFPSKVEVFILLFIFFQFYPLVGRNSKVHNFASSLLSFALFWEFYTPADGFSLEFEWQQVSSSLQDSSQYSGRSR